jgi:predicted nuclease of predicted toxin-antitoxin system
VTEIGLDRADGREILRAARDDKRVSITLDNDFIVILAWRKSSGPSVVFIRVEGLGA